MLCVYVCVRADIVVRTGVRSARSRGLRRKHESSRTEDKNRACPLARIVFVHTATSEEMEKDVYLSFRETERAFIPISTLLFCDFKHFTEGVHRLRATKGT